MCVGLWVVDGIFWDELGDSGIFWEGMGCSGWEDGLWGDWLWGMGTVMWFCVMSDGGF